MMSPHTRKSSKSRADYRLDNNKIKDIAALTVKYIELKGCVREIGEKYKKPDFSGLQHRKLTEKMENDCNDQVTKYLLSKQRESKAKLNSSGDSKSNAGPLGSVDDAILTDDNSGVDALFHERMQIFTNNRPARDAITYNAPKYEKADEEPIVDNDIAELQLQSHTDKTKQKALDTFVPTGPSVNKKALYLDETTYRLESFHKHALVIFNHKTFNNPDKPERLGTEIDVDVLKRTFENFDFEVTRHDDLEKDVLFTKARKFSERDFTDYGCVAVAILTHGSKDGMLQAKDQLYSEIQIINYFKPTKTKPTLVSKPKIFIIQACRGPITSPGVPVFKADSVLKDYVEENLQPYYILPLESDLLILHSSYPGCASHRIEKHGSWFIQKLCEEISKLSPTEHLESIITDVKRAVATDMGYIEYNTRTRMNQVSKQMPVMTSTLIRKLYLKKFGEQASGETYADKSRWRSESRHEVLDAVSSSPITPMLVQFGPCSCFLEHFTYMSNCLRHFVEENPKDETARDMLNVANAYENSYRFNKCKVEMYKLISKHLMDKARYSKFYKYLHFVPVEREVTQSKNAQNESITSPKSSFSSLNVFLIGIFGAFVFAFVFYEM